MKRELTDVLIVGGGPAGLVSGLLLAKLGVSSVILERNAQTDEHPKAHELNARSVEILSALDISEADLAKEASPLSDGSRVLFCRRINEEIGRIDLLADPERAKKYRQHLRSHLPYFNLSQSEFEKILVARAEREPRVDLRFRHRWESMDPGANTDVSRIADDETKETYAIESRVVIAADGASSPCRRALGIEMEGPVEIQNFVNAYFQLNLRAHIDTPAKLYWIFHPKYMGAFIAHHIEKRWVYAVPIFAPYESADDYPPEVLANRIRGALDYDGDVEIVSTSTWRMTAQVAQAFRAGRVFLVGDAAHRFPPTGGLGMNTGIADAHNLCWKLAAVLREHASDALLDTYESERRPIALRNCEESHRNFDKMFDVIESVGLHPSGPEWLARVTGNRIVRMLPAAIRRILRNVISFPADLLVRRAINNPRVNSRVGKSIADQIGHFDRLGLDIGYRYASGALIQDETEIADDPNGVTEYTPSCNPGARLPHVWLRRDGADISSHDLLGLDAFTLIINGPAADWHEAAVSVGNASGINIKTVAIGCDLADSDGQWRAIADLNPGGAILVRPDGHIAWRTNGPVQSAAETLTRVFKQLMGTMSPNTPTSIVAGEHE